MISFFEDIFQYEKFPTEFECLKQLSNIENYVAVPWTQIMNSHWLKFPGNRGRDYYLREISNYNIQTENNFTVCQHDSFKQLQLYFKHLKITKVFCTLHSQYDAIEGITLTPIPFTFNNTFKSNRNKDIIVSFVGAYITHPIREKLKDNLQGEYFIFRDSYHVDGDNTNKEKEEDEYRDVIERSIFSLCPRGSSPSSVRFWESLSAGAIPILISDDWVLPEWDWDNTLVRIPESDVAELTSETLLKMLQQKDVESMRNNCLLAWEKFNSKKFKDYILENI